MAKPGYRVSLSVAYAEIVQESRRNYLGCPISAADLLMNNAPGWRTRSNRVQGKSYAIRAPPRGSDAADDGGHHRTRAGAWRQPDMLARW